MRPESQLGSEFVTAAQAGRHQLDGAPKPKRLGLALPAVTAQTARATRPNSQPVLLWERGFATTLT